MTDETAADRVDAMLAPLIGRPAWGCKLGYGSFVTIEFGDADIADSENAPHGAWHLWVYGCAWRLEHGTEVLAGADDERDAMAAAVQTLEGRILEEVMVSRPMLDTVWRFADGYHLRLFPMSAAQNEHWMLYQPDGNVLCIGPGTSCTVERGDSPRGE